MPQQASTPKNAASQLVLVERTASRDRLLGRHGSEKIVVRLRLGVLHLAVPLPDPGHPVADHGHVSVLFSYKVNFELVRVEQSESSATRGRTD